MAPLVNEPDRDWERYGRTDPYFAVLSTPEYHGRPTAEARAEFFRSGEAHLECVLSIVRAHVDPTFAPARALHFGCGVGRVLIPLAARCAHVTGVDVSPAMLGEARRNCEAASAPDVELLVSDDALSAVTAEFDFIHSYIVLQHVPVPRGERLVRALAARLAPGGVGVFHVTYARARTSALSRLLYWARTRVPGAHWGLNLALGRPAGAPLMQINEYSVTRLLDLLRREGCADVHVRFSDHDGDRGVLLFARKAPVAVFT